MNAIVRSRPGALEHEPFPVKRSIDDSCVLDAACGRIDTRSPLVISVW
jgi:hypothetical protein